jgi:3-hydroxyacyl-CoA dehydrogenase
VIAALHGVAMGGGLELAMGCHWRVASPGTQLALPEVKLGILPGAGGTQRLPRALGVERALPLIMRGDVVKSEQVSGTLLVDALIEGDLLQGALAFTHRLLQEQAPALWLRRLRDQAASQAGAADDEALFAAARQLAATTLHGYPAPAKIVDAVQASVQLPFEDGLKFERQCFEELVLTSESRALRHAFFGERTVARVPDLPTDLPADIASAAIEHVAVIGNGALAQHLAKQFTQAGLTVLHLDAPAQSLDAAIGRADLGRIDLAIEALSPSADAPNNNPAQALAARCQLLSALDARLPAQALIASHSTWLDLRVLAAATQRPQQVLGLNMVSPLWLAEEAGSMRLLEVVRTGNTAVSALLRVLQLAKRLRKLTVVERIGDEVVGNPAGGNQAGGNQAGAAVAAAVAAIGASMLRRYLQAGQDLLAGAAHATQIDAALQSWGMRLGPFALRQLAGEQLPASLRPAPDANRTNITNIPNAPDDAAIVRHCLEALIDEGRRLLHTGVALREVDIDMVCLHGYGFAPYRGGPMFQAAELGLRPEPGL